MHSASPVTVHCLLTFPVKPPMTLASAVALAGHVSPMGFANFVTVPRSLKGLAPIKRFPQTRAWVFV